MTDGRPWYREPNTFIAVAALVVSVTAVVTGVYEAVLQRRHDRAEVWPNLEVATFTSEEGAEVLLRSTGVGPAIVRFIAVSVDDEARHNWRQVVRALGDTIPDLKFGVETVFAHAVRAGETVRMLDLPSQALQSPFYPWIGRVRIQICYASVFGDTWMVSAKLGAFSRSVQVPACPAQADSTAAL